jgi:hypothetical protein
MRQALLRGIRPVSVRLNAPLKYHELSEEDHGVWMTDLPEELNQIAEMIWNVEPEGRVLVGGLGLGIVAKMVSEMEHVSDVVVVEKDQDVIRLCADKRAYDVVCEDIAYYLKNHDRAFDSYLLDTWAGTNEGTWWDEVFPLRRTIRNRFGRNPVIHCWAEDIMLGQVRTAIALGQRNWKYEGLPGKMTPRERERFLADVGLPSWEKKYGHLYPK